MRATTLRTKTPSRRHRLDLFVVINILLNHLEKVNPRLIPYVKQVLKDCDLLKKKGHPQYQSLAIPMEFHIRRTIGETHWNEALVLFAARKRLRAKVTKKAIAPPVLRQCVPTANPFHNHAATSSSNVTRTVPITYHLQPNIQTILAAYQAQASSVKGWIICLRDLNTNNTLLCRQMIIWHLTWNCGKDHLTSDMELWQRSSYIWHGIVTKSTFLPQSRILMCAVLSLALGWYTLGQISGYDATIQSGVSSSVVVFLHWHLYGACVFAVWLNSWGQVKANMPLQPRRSSSISRTQNLLTKECSWVSCWVIEYKVHILGCQCGGAVHQKNDSTLHLGMELSISQVSFKNCSCRDYSHQRLKSFQKHLKIIKN